MALLLFFLAATGHLDWENFLKKYLFVRHIIAFPDLLGSKNCVERQLPFIHRRVCTFLMMRKLTHLLNVDYSTEI